MRYFQCSKCKELTTTASDTPDLVDIVHHERRMRELTKDQFDHETDQRAYIAGGEAPLGTALMEKLDA